MRLLADENFPKPIVETLRADGHDVLWVRTDLAGTSDVALLNRAESEARTRWKNPESFCSEFILQLAKTSHRSCVRLSRQTRRGLDTSASSRLMEFRWWRRAEGEAPLFSPADSRAEICASDEIAHVSSSRLAWEPPQLLCRGTDYICFTRRSTGPAPTSC